jgi:hypothetical protein
LHGLQSLTLRILVIKFFKFYPLAINLVIWFILRHLLALTNSKLLDLHILSVDLVFKRLDFLSLLLDLLCELLISLLYLDWLLLIFEFKTALLKFLYLDYQLLILKLKSRILVKETIYQEYLLPDLILVLI